jgi:hypothetical protein
MLAFWVTFCVGSLEGEVFPIRTGRGAEYAPIYGDGQAQRWVNLGNNSPAYSPVSSPWIYCSNATINYTV